jgi:hypothetical protein
VYRGPALRPLLLHMLTGLVKDKSKEQAATFKLGGSLVGVLEVPGLPEQRPALVAGGRAAAWVACCWEPGSLVLPGLRAAGRLGCRCLPACCCACCPC